MLNCPCEFWSSLPSSPLLVNPNTFCMNKAYRFATCLATKLLYRLTVAIQSSFLLGNRSFTLRITNVCLSPASQVPVRPCGDDRGCLVVAADSKTYLKDGCKKCSKVISATTTGYAAKTKKAII